MGAILAILTAVVSENMIRATERAELQEAAFQREEAQRFNYDQLVSIFEILDIHGNKMIDEEGFAMLLDDEQLGAELCDASGLTTRDLEDLFLVLSEEDSHFGRRIHFEDFVDKLQKENATVRERSIFRLEKEIRLLEKRMNAELVQL